MVKVLGIGGCTRSGKSSVAKEIEKRLGGFRYCRLIKLDQFFQTGDIPVDEETGYPNWEIPEAVEWEALEKAARDAVAAASRDARTKLIIIEGFLVFHSAPLVSLMDARVFLELGLEEAKHRRMRTTPVPQDYYDKLVWPSYLKYNEQLINEPPAGYFVVDAAQPFPLVFQTIAHHLLGQLAVDVDESTLAGEISVWPAGASPLSDTHCDVCKWWVPSGPAGHNCEARQLATQAEALEKRGEAMAAMELYAKAVKMDPELEQLL